MRQRTVTFQERGVGGASSASPNQSMRQESLFSVLDRLIAQMKKAEGVTEELKGRDQMARVGRMNNIKARAEEIVLAEVVYYDAYD